jgi:hypothetical protein
MAEGDAVRVDVADGALVSVPKRLQRSYKTAFLPKLWAIDAL